MSLQLESAQERLAYQEPEAFSYSTASDNCKKLGMVLYNNRCMHRNTPCCNGKGYLAQRKEDIGWGVCLTYRTGTHCTNAPKQTNLPIPMGADSIQKGLQNIWDYTTKPTTSPPSPFMQFPHSLRESVGLPTPSNPNPKTSAIPGTKNPESPCINCTNPFDVGCSVGKQFCEFQAWLTKQTGGLLLPAAAVSGIVILLLMLKR